MSRIQMFVTNPVTNDTRVLRESAALADAGHDVEVVGVLEPGSSARDRIGAVEIVRLERENPVSRWARRALAARRGAGGEQPETHPAEPGTVVTRQAEPGTVVTPEAIARGGIALRAALGAHLTLNWLTFSTRALALARRRPSDVVVAHDLDTLPVAAAVARTHGSTLLYDSHELYVEHESEPPRARLTRRLQRLAEGRLIRRADRVLTVNTSIAEELERRYGVPRPEVVMNVPAAPPGDSQPVDLRAEVGIDAGAPVALYVGGLAPGRGLEQLMASAAHMPGVSIVVIGPAAPHYRAQLAEMASHVGAGDRIFLRDAVPPSEVTRWAATADVGVVALRNTCLNNYLALPNKLFEYLSAGLPVVTSDFPELRRIVREHRVGVTFDSDDPADLARAVLAVVPPAAEAPRMREAAREAGRLFTWERERGRLLSAFDGLVAHA